jgi:hypothetical protein
MAIAKFAQADFIAFIECVENVVLLLAVTVCLQRLRVYKSNRLHGVTNILNIYSNICTYRLLLCLQTFNKVKSTTFIVFLSVKAMLHGAIFLATCNAILLLRDVNYQSVKNFRYVEKTSAECNED